MYILTAPYASAPSLLSKYGIVKRGSTKLKKFKTVKDKVLLAKSLLSPLFNFVLKISIICLTSIISIQFF